MIAPFFPFQVASEHKLFSSAFFSAVEKAMDLRCVVG